MQLRFRNLTITSGALDIGSVTLDTVSFHTSELVMESEGEPRIQFEAATAKLALTEARLNILLADAPQDKVRNLDVKTYAGRIVISGKQAVIGPIYLPFTLNAQPEIESGVRLRLNVTDFHVAKSLSLPAAVVHYIESKLNKKLGDSFDASKLLVPVRFLSVESEPGRLIISAEIHGGNDISLRIEPPEFGVSMSLDYEPAPL